MKFRAALIQMRAGRDMARNLADASDMIRAAKAAGASFLTTPEMTNILEPDRPRLKALVRAEADDASVAAFAGLARELGVWLNIGSLALRGDHEKLVNRSLLFRPDGTIAARYDKIHLFDVDLPTGESLRESHAYDGGQDVPVVATAFGSLGMTICYDVRFPRLYRSLANSGALFITVPSAFTVPTGEAHWHVLLRARAIETGSFVLAAAQGGRHESGRETYGHSLAVAPWGDVLVEGGTEPEVLTLEIDTDQVAVARQSIPAWMDDGAFDLQTLITAQPIAS